MKKYLFAALLFAGMSVQAYAQTKYKVVTVVESIIPMGLGRSRMIETKTDLDVRAATTERTSGNDSKQGDVERKDLKADAFAETKLLNFFSAVGINFQNIASNDALVASKLDQLAAEGWELAFVTSGVESKGGKDDEDGIFITRYVFKKVILASKIILLKPSGFDACKVIGIGRFAFWVKRRLDYEATAGL